MRPRAPALRLPKLHASIVISATPEVVWDVLVDPIYAPKLYRDILFMEVDPAGKGVKGQKRRAVARAGRTRIEILGVVTDAQRPSKFVLEELPGALFARYRESFQVSGSPVGAKVQANFDYELSREYLRGALNIVLLEDGIAESLRSFLTNLKDIAELKPLPG